MTLSSTQKKKLVEYWQMGSVKDLETATDIISKTTRYAGGLFFLHLSIEKKLKALFVHKNGEQSPFSHNLVSLVEKCASSPESMGVIWLGQVAKAVI